MYVELDIRIYVPRNTTFRDIDNKLKTVCDGLRLPERRDETIYSNPLICLLEDDDLIYKLNTDVDYLMNTDHVEGGFFGGSHGSLWLINVNIKGLPAV